jgi:hypothetical protein
MDSKVSCDFPMTHIEEIFIEKLSLISFSYTSNYWSEVFSIGGSNAFPRFVAGIDVFSIY